jgi:DNA-directed RNA polymerase subunit beta'
MLKTTLGRLLIDQALPEGMRGRNAVFDKKGLNAVFQELAEKYPDQYREVTKRLSDIGRDAATSTGSFSFRLKDMLVSPSAMQMRQQLQGKLNQILAKGDLNDDDRAQQIVDAAMGFREPMEKKIFDESREENNPFWQQIASGARGNAGNLKSLRGSDLLYVDHKGRPIPIPVLRSYSEGLSPVEYFAGTFGARKGVLDTKGSTQDSGYLAKQLNQVNHRLVTVGTDDPDDYDHGNRGLPVDTEDADNEGAFLASPVAGYDRNTILTPKVLRDIQDQGFKRILVRSPTVGGPGDGVWSRDVGVRERGFLPRRGDFVGLAAAQALSEKLTQGQLSSKHSGGVAGADKAVSGFKLIDQFVQVPKTFKSGASISKLDGRVNEVTPAPQGGFFVTVGNDRHYVGHGHEVKVKPGDEVEAGDVLSDGIPNPAEIIEHKGIGEGRRYYTKAFAQAYREAGMGAHRRNVELLARGLINHVRLDDELDDRVPNDIVSYQQLERNWQPRASTIRMHPGSAKGKYLEKPVLHYTIGTKIRPSVVKELQEFGIQNIDVNDDPPPFTPVMIRGMANLEQDEDVVSRHLGSNLEKSTLKAVHRGDTIDPFGTSYPSAMAMNPLNFGREGLTQGWEADPLKPKKSLPSVLDGL